MSMEIPAPLIVTVLMLFATHLRWKCGYFECQNSDFGKSDGGGTRGLATIGLVLIQLGIAGAICLVTGAFVR